MLFNSYIFILVFLPSVVAGYFLLNHYKHYKMAMAFLTIMSLWFYGYFNYMYLLIIIASIIFNYFVSMIIIRRDGLRKTFCFGIAVSFNIGLLFYFKYYDFFISNINTVFGSSFNLHYVMLPLGISFFTFQQLSYIIDSYQKHIPGGGYRFAEYAAFVTFFPQLIAGPIVLHSELIPQFRDMHLKKLDYYNLSRGFVAYTMGMAKKVLLADTFGKTVTYGFGNIDQLDSLSAFLVMLAYTFQIYFDFSGYADMATGLGLMFNIELPMNFNSPYKSLSIAEFWKRWHMTLTRFLTQYIYIPLGGSRKGRVRTYINVLIVFFFSGVWHGANWTFICWGLMHGLASVLNRIFKNQWDNLHAAFRWLVTFTFINLTWVYFRANSIAEGNKFLYELLSLNFEKHSNGLYDGFNLLEFRVLFGNFMNQHAGLMMWIFFAFAGYIVLNVKNVNERILTFKPRISLLLLTLFLFIWSVLSLTEVSVFLYFNF